MTQFYTCDRKNFYVCILDLQNEKFLFFRAEKSFEKSFLN